MSDKYITYGPGKDIDPEEVEASIKWAEEREGYFSPLERKIWTALQQREERLRKARQQLDYDMEFGVGDTDCERMLEILEDKQ